MLLLESRHGLMRFRGSAECWYSPKYFVRLVLRGQFMAKKAWRLPFITPSIPLPPHDEGRWTCHSLLQVEGGCQELSVPHLSTAPNYGPRICMERTGKCGETERTHNTCCWMRTVRQEELLTSLLCPWGPWEGLVRWPVYLCQEWPSC